MAFTGLFITYEYKLVRKASWIACKGSRVRNTPVLGSSVRWVRIQYV